MKVQMTPKREKIVSALRGADRALTLAEISDIIGETVVSGTTNSMVSAGIIRKAGKTKVAKVVYVEVDTYTVGE